MNKQNNIRIHFIIEGDEEELLFKLVKEYGISDCFDVTYTNSCGAGRLAMYYYDALSTDNYDLVLCVYDVDYAQDKKDSAYNETRRQLLSIVGSEKTVDMVSLCTNPNILLIILLGYDVLDSFRNISKSKIENTKLIKKYCKKIGNKKPYDASSWQLDLIHNDFYSGVASYDKILEKCDELSINYKTNEIGSNILPILKAIKNGDIQFINKIIKNIDLS